MQVSTFLKENEQFQPKLAPSLSSETKVLAILRRKNPPGKQLTDQLSC